MLIEKKKKKDCGWKSTVTEMKSRLFKEKQFVDKRNGRNDENGIHNGFKSRKGNGNGQGCQKERVRLSHREFKHFPGNNVHYRPIT